jgi:hypothetical protein
MLLAGTLLGAPGCTSIKGDHPDHLLIPARTLNVSRSLTIPAESIAIAGALFYVVDPLAPNWKVEVASLGDRRYRMALTMKRFTTGGEGEVTPVLRRAAEKLRAEGGYAGFVVLEQSEGIESRVPIAQRVAHALIELY